LVRADYRANKAAAASVNFTNDPLSRSHSQPLARGRSSPALHSAGVPFRPVYLLDVDATVLQRFEGVGRFDDFARGDLGIGEGAVNDEFHAAGIRVGCRSYIGHKRWFCNGPTVDSAGLK